MPCCQLFAAGSDTYTSYGYCETITPDSGYQMAEGSLTYSLAVAGGETVKITGNRFTMPAGNVTITCKWETATTTAKGITSFSISGVVGAVNNTTNTIICNRMAVVPVLFCGGGNRALVTRPVQFYDLMVFHCALPSFCVKAFHLYRQQK